MKKIALFALLSLGCCACSTRMGPDHLAVTPSYEMEFHGSDAVKHRPKIETTLGWNF